MEYPCKRPFDFTLALIGLALSSPLWLIIALAIYVEDRGPVIFMQERGGRDGKTFKILKFRTMLHIKDNKHMVFSPEFDPRVTRVGNVLRATAMDELPNLVNILKGDMSFVGPKPLPLNIEKPGAAYSSISDVPGYNIRCKVRPGLTGIAQVYAPKDLGHAEKFRYDNLYVEKMSLWLDLKLILLSFWITFKGKWEHRGKKI